jgi:hypothetical protein
MKKISAKGMQKINKEFRPSSEKENVSDLMMMNLKGRLALEFGQVLHRNKIHESI